MIRYSGLTESDAQRYLDGGHDAYDLAPEIICANGPRNPCRHCLSFVPEGQEMLVLAYQPFSKDQPYAETGPIFLCGDTCRNGTSTVLPDVLRSSLTYLIKGYTADERILYGTGAIVEKNVLEVEIEARLLRPEIAFVDIRSAANNCWLARARRE